MTVSAERELFKFFDDYDFELINQMYPELKQRKSKVLISLTELKKWRRKQKWKQRLSRISSTRKEVCV